MADIAAIFKAVDKDSNGIIDPIELQAALAKGGFILSLTTCSQLIRLHDRNNDNNLDFQEFQQLHEFISKAQGIFDSLNGGTSAKINIQQLQSGLAQLGYALEKPAFDACCKAFDPEKDGMFGLTEFIALLGFLKASVGTFRGFAAQGTDRITLTMNQFIYAAANTR